MSIYSMSDLKKVILVLTTGTLLIATLVLLVRKPTRVRDGAARVRIIENAGKGDCLFYCYQQALSSLKQRMSIQDMRRAVAGTMTQEKFETLKTIYNMAKQDGDTDLLNDYGWVADSQNLKQLKAHMMKPTYFGDEIALAALEKLTGLNTIVVKDGAIQKRAEKRQPTGLWIVLLLKNVHYRILALDQTLVFKDQVPATVVKLAQNQL